MKFELMNPLDRGQWDELVLSFKDHTFFHSSAWARVLIDTYHFKPNYLAVSENGSVVALLPAMEVNGLCCRKKSVSLPFSDYCWPLVRDDMHVRGLYSKIITEHAQDSWKYIEFRGGEKSAGPVTASNVYYRHLLELNHDEDQMLSGFRNSTKRNIKSAEKEGVAVSISSSREAVHEFYVLNCITRQTHGLPPQPKVFFDNIYKHIISTGSGIVVLAHKDKTVIAGSMYFHYGEKALFKYGASNPKYNSLKANYAVMWEAIKYYAQKGYKTLSFGRTHPKNTGLLQYKDGWNTQKELIKYYTYDFMTGSFIENKTDFSGFYTKIFQKTPIPFLKLIGSKLYKYMG